MSHITQMETVKDTKNSNIGFPTNKINTPTTMQKFNIFDENLIKESKKFEEDENSKKINIAKPELKDPFSSNFEFEEKKSIIKKADRISRSPLKNLKGTMNSSRSISPLNRRFNEKNIKKKNKWMDRINKRRNSPNSKKKQNKKEEEEDEIDMLKFKIKILESENNKQKNDLESLKINQEMILENRFQGMKTEIESLKHKLNSMKNEYEIKLFEEKLKIELKAREQVKLEIAQLCLKYQENPQLVLKSIHGNLEEFINDVNSLKSKKNIIFNFL